MLTTESRNALFFGFGLGAFAAAAQTALLREALTVAAGDELVLGVGFASWLCGIGFGAVGAAKRARPGGAAFLAAQLALVPMALLGVAALRLHGALPIKEVGAEPSAPVVFALLGAALAPCAGLIGWAFTDAARTARSFAAQHASRIYAAEALGTVVSGLAFGLGAAGRIDHVTAIALFGGVSYALFGGVSPSFRARAALGSASALCLALAISGATSGLDALVSRAAFASDPSRGTLVAARDSAYGRLAIGDRDGQLTLFADGRPAYSFPDPWERPVQVHLTLAAHPKPRSALLLGGGAPDRLEAALSHGVSRAVLTYLDAAEHEIGAPYWPEETRRALADPRVVLARDDGRRYVARTAEKFDAIVVSTPPPRTARANRYHTAEFFAQLRRTLARGGVVSVRIPAGANAVVDEAARAAASVLQAVRESFPATALAPGAEAIVLAAAREEDLVIDPAVFSRRLSERSPADARFSRARFEELLDPPRARLLEKRLERVDAPVNRDGRPFAYLAGIALGGKRRADSFQGRESLESRAATALPWLLAALPFVAWIAVRPLLGLRKRVGAFDALFSVATTGAGGMGVQLLILHAFQTSAGVLYGALAGLVAAFMAGLALGAKAGTRAFPGGFRSSVAADVAALAVFAASGPILAWAMGDAWVAVVWSVVAGAATGAAFPAFLSEATRVGSPGRSFVGAIEAADHLGAAFGALAVGTALLPALGITNTCLLFAGLKAASLLGHALGRHRR